MYEMRGLLLLLQLLKKKKRLLTDGKKHRESPLYVWIQRGLVICPYPLPLPFLYLSSHPHLLTFGILIFYPGGDVTLAEVRQKQQINHQSMKLQKKVHAKLFTLESIHLFSVELYIYLNITANYLHIPFLSAAIKKKKNRQCMKTCHVWDAVIHFYFSSHPLLFIQK